MEVIRKFKIKTIATICFTFFLIIHYSCEKEDEQYLDNERTIEITKNIILDNGIKVKDPDLNLIAYENFLKYLHSSDRFLIVTQKDFEKTSSKDKVVLSIRHDIDGNIDGAIRMAYREHKYGIKATYFVLPTASYYGKTKLKYFKRNDRIIYYMKKLQDSFGHEIGFHNDLVTLQIVYGIEPKAFLADQLKWLRENGISIVGTCAHGSSYCYVYHYLNTYFWNKSPNFGGNFSNYESVVKTGGAFFKLNNEIIDKNFEEDTNEQLEPSSISDINSSSKIYGIKIIKDNIENYNLEYDSDYFFTDYNFSDCKMYEGKKRWHVGMEDFGNIPIGSKVIILIHPTFWD